MLFSTCIIDQRITGHVKKKRTQICHYEFRSRFNSSRCTKPGLIPLQQSSFCGIGFVQPIFVWLSNVGWRCCEAWIASVLCSCESHFKFIAPIYPQDCPEMRPAELSGLALLNHRLEPKKGNFPIYNRVTLKWNQTPLCLWAKWK